MKQIALITLAGTLILGPVMLAAQDAGVPVAAGAVTQEITGTVVVVNPQARMLTIRQPDGVFQVIHVPDAVQRLDEIRINDTLTIDFVEAIAIDLQKGEAAAGAPGAVATRDVDREGGRLPAGSIQETITLVGIVEAVNAAASKVTIRGPENTVSVNVRDPALLADVKVGDSVTLTYISAVAASVERSGPPRHTRPGSQ
jgi:Cu/Ag efflux protein CusF